MYWVHIASYLHNKQLYIYRQTTSPLKLRWHILCHRIMIIFCLEWDMKNEYMISDVKSDLKRRYCHKIQYSLSWWRHQMETFSAALAICAGNSPVPGEFPPHKGQWRGALMFALICAWKKNDWVHNREAGDLRRYRAHYDVIVRSQLAVFSRDFTQKLYKPFSR